MNIPFVKMHVCGNDYVFIDGTSQAVPDVVPLAKAVSRPHFGIGSDGLIVMRPGQQQNLAMDMFNADGSEGEMCGMGLAAFSVWAVSLGYEKSGSFTIETKAGLRTVEARAFQGTKGEATINLGKALLESEAAEELSCDDFSLKGYQVSMGNPHFVVPISDLKQCQALERGEKLQHHAQFKNGVNVEWVTTHHPDHLELVVYERGSGLTQACGTGGAAVFAAMHAFHQADSPCKVTHPGGSVRYHRNAEDEILMTADVFCPFKGEYGWEPSGG